MRRCILPILLVVEIAVFASLGGIRGAPGSGLGRYFFSYAMDLVAQSGPVLLLGFGMTLVLMTAGIDLSVGSITALVACVMSCFPGGRAFWWTAVPAGLLAGVILGMFNGLLVASLDVPPIIATLGTMIFYRGLCFVVMGELEKAPFLDVPGYEWLGQVQGVTVLVCLVFVAGGWWLYRSRWRREILMLGGSRVAARYAGIPVSRRLWEVYALTGFMAFLAALCFTARNSSVSASSRTGIELHVIVAVVLGGTGVQGGAGTMLGTFFGVLTIAVLDEGLRGAVAWGDQHLPFRISDLEFVLMGILLLTAVWLTKAPRGSPAAAR